MTTNEKRIYALMIDDVKRFSLMSIGMVAQKLDISKTTLMRFAKSAGFNGYSDFKKALQEEELLNLFPVDKIKKIIRNDTKISADQVHMIELNNIDTTYDDIMDKDLDSLVDTIVAAKTIYTMGWGPSHYAADIFSMRMKLIGLMLPYTIAFMLLGMLYLFYLYSMWEFQGSFAIMIFGMLLTVVAYQVIALLFFVIGFDYARSLSLGAVYTAPAFAFLGVTFPIYNMNGFALFWRDMLPVSHYTQLQLSQANYGADVFLEVDKLWTLFAFWILFLPVVLLVRKRLKKEMN